MNDFTPDQAAEIPQTPYAREIETHVGQDYIDRLTHIFKDIGVSDWLEQYPLSRLELRETVLNKGRPVNGVYSFKQKSLRASTTRERNQYGYPFEWQRVNSVSSTAETQFLSIQITLVHELGHHIHNMLGITDRTYFDATLRFVFLQGGTNYANLDNIEYFAESFALYVYYPTELLVKDPQGYGMIEKTLEILGLEVRQQ
jgi:hypothetical protein